MAPENHRRARRAAAASAHAATTTATPRPDDPPHLDPQKAGRADPSDNRLHAEVGRCHLQPLRIVTEKPEPGVAGRAQQPPHARAARLRARTTPVVVIHDQLNAALRRLRHTPADRTLTVLLNTHGAVLLSADAVRALNVISSTADLTLTGKTIAGILTKMKVLDRKPQLTRTALLTPIMVPSADIASNPDRREGLIRLRLPQVRETQALSRRRSVAAARRRAGSLSATLTQRTQLLAAIPLGVVRLTQPLGEVSSRTTEQLETLRGYRVSHTHILPDCYDLTRA